MSDDTELQHRAAIIAVLNLAGARPLTLEEADEAGKDETGGGLPTSYTEVYVSERYHQEFRRGGNGVGGRSWRVQTRAVARIEDNASTMRTRARNALEGLVLTISGVETTPIERAATDDPIRPDDGWYSGLSEWTYYL